MSNQKIESVNNTLKVLCKKYFNTRNQLSKLYHEFLEIIDDELYEVEDYNITTRDDLSEPHNRIVKSFSKEGLFDEDSDPIPFEDIVLDDQIYVLEFLIEKINEKNS